MKNYINELSIVIGKIVMYNIVNKF